MCGVCGSCIGLLGALPLGDDVHSGQPHRANGNPGYTLRGQYLWATIPAVAHHELNHFGLLQFFENVSRRRIGAAHTKGLGLPAPLTLELLCRFSDRWCPGARPSRWWRLGWGASSTPTPHARGTRPIGTFVPTCLQGCNALQPGSTPPALVVA